MEGSISSKLHRKWKLEKVGEIERWEKKSPTSKVGVTELKVENSMWRLNKFQTTPGIEPGTNRALLLKTFAFNLRTERVAKKNGRTAKKSLDKKNFFKHFYFLIDHDFLNLIMFSETLKKLKINHWFCPLAGIRTRSYQTLLLNGPSSHQSLTCQERLLLSLFISAPMTSKSAINFSNESLSKFHQIFLDYYFFAQASFMKWRRKY